MIRYQVKRIIVICCFFFLHGFARGQEIQKIKATDLERTIAESQTPLIINMWATWCVPCIEEIPYFLEEVKKHRKDSLKILLVSLDFKEDFPKGIAAVVKKRKFDAPVAWLDETNADYFCPKLDSNWQGGLPASLFINNKTGYRKFYEQKLSHSELKKEIMAILGKN